MRWLLALAATGGMLACRPRSWKAAQEKPASAAGNPASPPTDVRGL